MPSRFGSESYVKGINRADLFIETSPLSRFARDGMSFCISRPPSKNTQRLQRAVDREGKRAASRPAEQPGRPRLCCESAATVTSQTTKHALVEPAPRSALSATWCTGSPIRIDVL